MGEPTMKVVFLYVDFVHEGQELLKLVQRILHLVTTIKVEE